MGQEGLDGNCSELPNSSKGSQLVLSFLTRDELRIFDHAQASGANKEFLTATTCYSDSISDIRTNTAYGAVWSPSGIIIFT